MPSRLNSTDFAILGLLARRPWSAYEMAQYMRTSNIRAVWPRAESRIYESPKKLASLGFASSTQERQGKRSRMVYAITDAGRNALAAWLQEEGKGFTLEYEALLKLDLGDIGQAELQDQLLHRLIAQGEADWQQIEPWFQQFAEGPLEDAPEWAEVSADRRAQNLLINSFLFELLIARRRWSRFAQDFSEQYASGASEAEKDALIAARYRSLLEENDLSS